MEGVDGRITNTIVPPILANFNNLEKIDFIGL